MPFKIDVLKDGYSTVLPNKTMLANGTSTLVEGQGVTLLVDTLTAWDKDELIKSLTDRNLHCNDVNYVVCTHGHSDHVGNLNLFTEANLHIVGWNSVHVRNEFINHPFCKGVPYELSAGLRVIPTPGHTLSDVSVVVEGTKFGTTIITGDLFEKLEDIEEPSLWKDSSENIDLQVKYRKQILDLADYIIPGHGPGFPVTQAMKETHNAMF